MELNKIYHSNKPEFIGEFARTDVMQRLKSVGMECGCEYTGFPAYRNSLKFSRYAHSIGVALIVWHFTEDIAQSVAGLLHDISTPAFSHTIDFLNEDYLDQESTEEGTEEIIARSQQLQSLLRKYGLREEEVNNYHKYPIADNDSPKLSADRLEYTFRHFISYGRKTMDDVKRYYSDLTVGTNEEGRKELMFAHQETALEFAGEALYNSRIYISDEDRYAMLYLAGLLRKALEHNVISREDLYTTEPLVIAKLQASPETAKAWNRFRSLSRIMTNSQKPQEEGWVCIAAKKRFIDPAVVSAGRASDFSNELRQAVRDFQATDFNHWILAV